MSVDHIVYAVPDLEEGVASIEERLGVRAAPGGRHESTGSHNALLGLGGATYLEIIAPDPTNPNPPRPRSFNMDQDRNPRLGGWATRSADIDATVARARAAGYDPGPVWPLSRRRPDGVLLEWRLTRSDDSGSDFVLPFVIDWGQAQHPSTTSPQGAVLRGLAIEHPDPDRIARALAALGVEDVDVLAAPRPALIATIQPAGGGPPVDLR